MYNTLKKPSIPYYEEVKSRKFKDKNLINLREKVLQDKAKEAILNYEGVLRIWVHLLVPCVGNLIPTILVEARN